MRLPIVVSFLHKWIGLIIGVQIILWISGGVIMSWFPIDEVRGQHNVADQAPVQIAASDSFMPVPDALSLNNITEADQVTMRSWLGRIIYEVRADEIHLIDARSGFLLSPLNEAVARSVALADYAGDVEIMTSELLNETNLEYRGATPVWRFDFDDEDETHLYVSPQTGRIVARRNATWRLFDFFWMLHIMDYEDRENFNHPLLITASISALIMVLMGVSLLFWRIRLRDWRVVFGRRK